MAGPGADEGQHAARVSYRDGAVTELLEDLVGEGACAGGGEAEPQLRQGRGEQLEGGSLAAQSANAGHGFRTVPSVSCMSTRRSSRRCGSATESQRRWSGKARSRDASTRWRRTTRGGS